MYNLSPPPFHIKIRKINTGKYLLVVLIFMFCFSGITAQENEVLRELLQTMESAPKYDSVKSQQINNLRTELEKNKSADLITRYNLNKQLLDEYKIFKQDSAFVYGIKTRNLAIQLNDEDLIADAIINLGDISVSAGMYKEALEFLEPLDPEAISPNLRSLYYGLIGRCYSEMAEYSNLPFFSTDYNALAADYRRTALELTEDNTFFNSFLKAFIKYNTGNFNNALKDFQALAEQEQNLSMRESALVHYFLGDLYFQLDEKEKAISHFAQSSIFDIKTSTKENLASIRLAELLFERGEIKDASVFIQKAHDDAAFFGAQQRKIRVGAILPLIEEEIVQRIENQRESLYKQNIVVSLLLLFVIALAGTIYLQVRKLRRAKKVIVEAHENLQNTNNQLLVVNDQIYSKNQELNMVYNQLLEANKIKEEYIGFFFTQDADIFEKFREFKLKIEKNLKSENLDGIKHLMSYYDLKSEKEKLLQNFDEAFIKLFPKFIEEFNSLLKAEEQIEIKNGHILNKELRIFALMRLGINHNDIIAQILGYSVNSIYAYKTKIRKRSKLDKKDFDSKLFENTTLKL